MHRLLYCALCLTGMMELAWPQTNGAYSKNAVGYVKVALPLDGGSHAYAVNFVALGGSHLMLANVFGTNQLICDAVYARADKILIWNVGSQEFERYAQKPSGEFVTQENWDTGLASNPAMGNGVGV